MVTTFQAEAPRQFLLSVKDTPIILNLGLGVVDLTGGAVVITFGSVKEYHVLKPLIFNSKSPPNQPCL
ncbi:uncharacterized protein BO80DRAFT_69616 [Aspergillus ibericus CBS 121593]|uniref:Uncharacterized protein n=1 Tax=Aspergillus ibericus CBS 121593 TaxID=1448316 RepID=A0A395H0D3_9EURO|nr:hypothetical protein BO80DRAFT_69616 [Aspergillus ibericus CBS 121593]RAL01070.1 hypothetical protein BO80DRAFT_69616 [Aspergillus ibericus CBS 121593]